MRLKNTVWLLGLLSLNAHAVCVNGHPAIATEYTRSKAVIIGIVVAQKHVPQTSDGYFLEGTMYEVKVERNLRNASSSPAIQLFNENSSGRFDMITSTRYLLFVYEEHGRLRVDSCGNSAELSKSATTLSQVEKLATNTTAR
jgi:hypothetical protein